MFLFAFLLFFYLFFCEDLQYDNFVGVCNKQTVDACFTASSATSSHHHKIEKTPAKENVMM
jgi:hypothetical protein